MYFTGGEDGVYMRIQKDGVLEAGNYEGAFLHIGEATFKPVVTKQFDSFSEAYKSAMEAGGKQFMVDMFSSSEPQPLVRASKPTKVNPKTDKPSVLKEIRDSRTVPKSSIKSTQTKDKTEPSKSTKKKKDQTEL
jgi:hypothetical protein